MLQPPVSTPTSRMTAMPMSRSTWYSRSVSVIAGATVIESPVCTPIGSRFSIEQTTTTLSCAVAHELELVLLPAEDRLLEEHLGGRRVRAGPRRRCGAGRPRRRRSRSRAPPMVKRRAGRRPGSRAPRRRRGTSSIEWQIRERATDAGSPSRSAMRSTTSLNSSRSSPASMASTLAPISSTPYLSSTPVLVQRDRGVERGLAAEGRAAARRGAPWR